MKSGHLMFGVALVAVAFTSCKNEKHELAKKTIEVQTHYVDSIVNISSDEAKANWAAIEAAYLQHVSESEAIVNDAADPAKVREDIDRSKAKYDEFKAKIEAEIAAAASKGVSGNQAVRDALFGAGKLTEDRSFAWVNKDNILAVYEGFYNTYDKNKDNYSREDLDEIKAIYEALDAHKNTVEKQGLSGEDNRKIAALKTKFAPSFRWERMTSKSEENQAAKDQAK